MTSTEQPRRVVDLETLATNLTDRMIDAVYAVRDDVAPDGFATFDVGTWATSADEVVVRAVVDHVSDGEDPIADAAGEVLEVVVRRVTR